MECFISICITSYDRPEQIKRCLDSIETKYQREVEIVVGDDRSPSWQEISSIVGNYKQNSSIPTSLIINEENVGYDLNFYNIIKNSSGKYLLFITDDDAFLPGSIDKVFEKLKNKDLSLAFTPYLNRETGLISRRFNKDFFVSSGISSVEEHLYHSVLLSGLIFKRDAIPDYDSSSLKGLIYSQVFVFICVLYEKGGGYVNVPLVDYIGDGQNGFGTNAGEEENSLLANRTHYLSNLEYNKRLAKVIGLFDQRYGTTLFDSISRAYSLRTIVGLCYARGFGINAMREYKNALSQVGFKLGVLPTFYYYALRIMGLRFSLKALQFAKYAFREWTGFRVKAK